MTKRIFVLAALMSAVCVTGAFAQVTVSGGFALSSVKDIEVSGSGSQGVEADIGAGANLFVDYLLPIGIPLSLGGEVGVDSASFKYDENYTDTVIAIPLLLRAAYHFDLLPKLDLYIVGKIGYVIGIWEGETKDAVKSLGASVGDIGGIGFGFDVGAAYYFNSKFGLFAEVGFDDYALESEITGSGYNQTLKAPFNRFLTIGVSGKF
ncbi:MAG: outer membrane beta-barrel protein [Spirochaetaceae bacterium]|nr:outer membrane beta-barrel protein [Spirochaetaceae bacterium]